MRNEKGKALVICGPTACGKSDLADLAADLISERLSGVATVAVVDSMQVYKEIPKITNQARRRRAELTGVVSVSEEWTMVRHREACDNIMDHTDLPLVLDAGTGLYLNAFLLDIPIASQVPEKVRRCAQTLNSHNTSEISGFGRKRSIWDEEPRHSTEIVYIRPDRSMVDKSIAHRSEKIASEGIEEAESLEEKFPEEIPNYSVRNSIGVRELLSHLQGDISKEEAEQKISSRTRKLARRQMRWFDKLVRTIDGKADSITVSGDSKASEKAISAYSDRLQANYA